MNPGHALSSGTPDLAGHNKIVRWKRHQPLQALCLLHPNANFFPSQQAQAPAVWQLHPASCVPRCRWVTCRSGIPLGMHRALCWGAQPPRVMTEQRMKRPLSCDSGDPVAATSSELEGVPRGSMKLHAYAPMGAHGVAGSVPELAAPLGLCSPSFADSLPLLLPDPRLACTRRCMQP